MARCTRKPQAERDLVDIWLYIARDSPSAADKLLYRIDAMCDRLARNAYLGRTRDDLAPGLRYFVVGKYLILYRKTDDGADIVRVVHGARNLPDLF